MIEVRCHLPSVAEYVALTSAVGWPAPSEEACERALAATVVSVGAFEGTRLVGMGRVVGDGAENWLLVDVVVDPQHQGRSVGSALIDALETEVSNRSPGSTVLLFCPSRAVPFYEGLGYEAAPGTFMRKVLSTSPERPGRMDDPARSGRACGDPSVPWQRAAPPPLRPPAIP